MDAALDELPCGVLRLTDECRVVGANRALLELVGYAADELEGAHLDRILPVGARLFLQTHLFPLLRIQGTAEEISLSLLTRKGASVPVLLNARRREGEGGLITCALFRVSARHAYEGELLRMKNALREQAERDELTGAYNRRALMERLGEERARADRGGGTFSVALMDLDRFKGINDRFGHAVGDEVLRGFARAARAVLRSGDCFGRFGGEEFLLVASGASPGEAAAAVERIRAAARRVDWQDIAEGLSVTVSAGVAGYRAGEDVAALLQSADEALYRAKHAGRDRVVMHESAGSSGGQ